jgi:hypothetical protein
MPTREERRVNRKLVLQALRSETGSSGGDAAADRVKAFISDPVGAKTEEFAFVGALILTRFFIDPSKPNASERRSLWQELMNRFGASASDPGGWGGDTNVSQLQAIVEGELG